MFCLCHWGAHSRPPDKGRDKRLEQNLRYKWGHQIPTEIPTDYTDTNNINKFESTTRQLKPHLFIVHNYNLNSIVAKQLIQNQHAYSNASPAQRSTSAKITAQFADILLQHVVNLCTRDHHVTALVAHRAPGTAHPRHDRGRS